MEPSGADKGFIQRAPTLSNQFYDDDAYQRCFHLFLSASVISATREEVAALGRDVISDQIFRWITDAERNKPYLSGSGRDAFGRWTGDLITGEGWRELQKFGIMKGMVATGYDSPYGPFSRPLQFLRLCLWEPSCANVTCPSAMQDGAARLLQLQLGSSETKSRLSADQLRVYENAYFHLTSRDPAVAWTSGQWMTERTGGSDVSLTETIAVHKPTTSKEMASLDENIPLGPWSISGFKWFSSATDSDMTILLARTAAGGLSTFLAPMRIRKRSSDSETDVPQSPGYQLNGVRIQRLKNKVGTTSLPTAELVLDNMRGWLVGEQGKGIQQISTILTITRVHSSTAAVGYAGRSLSIARAFARVREIGAGKGGRIRLTDSPLHTRTLAKLTVEYRALMLLTFLTTYVLGLSEHTLKDGEVLSPSLASLTPRSKDVAPLLRVLGQITKAYVCKTSLAIVSACMEALGGVGYLDNEEQQYLNLSRIWRDCAVLPIWEGTTDVLSSDFVRAVKHPKAGRESLDALEHFISGAMKNQATPALSGWDPIKSWHNLRERIAEGEQLGLLRDARELVWEVCEIIMSVLLFVDARSDGDPLACDILERFVTEKFSAASSQQRLSMNEKLQKDSAIAYGAVGVGSAAKL